MKSLLAEATYQSELFLRKIRKFNSCFKMTSFGATKMVQNEDGRNFQSTFKIQVQVYHQIGSLMPVPDTDSKFLQIYFMGDEEQQINERCHYNHIEQFEEREIVGILEPFLQNHNSHCPAMRYCSNLSTLLPILAKQSTTLFNFLIRWIYQECHYITCD